tara:strand:+ start:758 stop:1522 length:765 start_codon:yes stop_codon:yes gene_type:complete
VVWTLRTHRKNPKNPQNPKECFHQQGAVVIYGQAAYDRIQINHAVQGWVARMITSSRAFKHLCDRRHHGINTLSSSDFRQELMHVFSYEMVRASISGKGLDEHELQSLAHSVFQSLDPDDTDKVTLPEFVFAATSNEYLSMDDLVAMYDADRKRSFLERILDDTERDPEKINQKLKQTLERKRSKGLFIDVNEDHEDLKKYEWGYSLDERQISLDEVRLEKVLDEVVVVQDNDFAVPKEAVPPPISDFELREPP